MENGASVFTDAFRKRFEDLGCLHKREDKEFVSLPQLGISVEGAEGYRETPGRMNPEVCRLDELLSLAAAAGIRAEGEEAAASLADRMVTFTASDESRDRYGDRILVDGTLDGKTFKTPQGKRAKGWVLTNFMKNPVFMAFHEYSPTFSGNAFSGIPLGAALDTWTDEKKGRKRLRQTVLFSDGSSNPLAPLILNAYKVEKIMRAVSVGFMPEAYEMPQSPEERVEWDLGEWGYLFTQQELLELSAVSVPGNANALMESFDVTRRKDVGEFAAKVRDFAPALGQQLEETMRTAGRVSVAIKGAEEVERSEQSAEARFLDIAEQLGVLLSRLEGLVGELAGAAKHESRATSDHGPAAGNGSPVTDYAKRYSEMLTETCNDVLDQFRSEHGNGTQEG